MTNTKDFIFEAEKRIFMKAIKDSFNTTLTPFDIKTSLNDKVDNEYYAKICVIEIHTIRKVLNCIRSYLKEVNLNKYFCAGYKAEADTSKEFSILTRYEVRLRAKKKYVNTDELKLALTAYKLGNSEGA